MHHRLNCQDLIQEQQWYRGECIDSFQGGIASSRWLVQGRLLVSAREKRQEIYHK